MSKILVGLKRVVDYNVRIRVKPDNTGVITEGVKLSINPFDEIALEEALRIKERAQTAGGEAVEVIVVAIGAADIQQQLRTGRRGRDIPEAHRKRVPDAGDPRQAGHRR